MSEQTSTKTENTKAPAGRMLLIGWLAAFGSPAMLLAGSWLYLFPAQLQRGEGLVWAMTLGLAAIAILMGIAVLVKRRWLPGILLILATVVLFGLGILGYGVSVLYYFGTDRSLGFLGGGFAWLATRILG